MLRSLLIGLVAGQRSITPLALVAGSLQRGEVADDLPLAPILKHPLFTAGAVALAAAEMAGDKLESAPDRTVKRGLAVRALTSTYAGAAYAPRDRRVLGGLIGLATAMGSSFAGLALRKRAMRRYGRVESGFVEDVLVFGAGAAVAYGMRPKLP